MLIKDGWKLSGYFRWVPEKPDVKNPCYCCRGKGVDWFEEEKCSACDGNGFTYTIHPRGPEPELPKHLMKWMQEAYQEWEELYGNTINP